MINANLLEFNGRLPIVLWEYETGCWAGSQWDSFLLIVLYMDSLSFFVMNKTGSHTVYFILVVKLGGYTQIMNHRGYRCSKISKLASSVLLAGHGTGKSWTFSQLLTSICWDFSMVFLWITGHSHCQPLPNLPGDHYPPRLTSGKVAKFMGPNGVPNSYPRKKSTKIVDKAIFFPIIDTYLWNIEYLGPVFHCELMINDR